ncbi:hypothetical protein [Pseudomonas sp. 37 R 15]|uniref:cupin domain-containing protein n=1 Tax=Pseudomonas sp. 37 R 15 TaxID=1844104 RepID=UPI000812974B|nr:cupin domain-containing protein [Pseudomonas sp. 37 R 15]CRM38076.1 hypothetical protein [Pseudomonas sp. 37 R 15]
MDIRRIVVGTGKDGNGELLSDNARVDAITFKTMPGFSSALIWATDSQAEIGSGKPDSDKLTVSVVPSVGETRLFRVSMPPDSIMSKPDFDAAAFGQEIYEKMPEFAATFIPDEPGMHQTDTIDYDVLLEGEVVLELGNGDKIPLSRHDVVVQYGNKHAWRNVGNTTALLLFVLVGAKK